LLLGSAPYLEGLCARHHVHVYSCSLFCQCRTAFLIHHQIPLFTSQLDAINTITALVVVLCICFRLQAKDQHTSQQPQWLPDRQTVTVDPAGSQAHLQSREAAAAAQDYYGQPQQSPPSPPSTHLRACSPAQTTTAERLTFSIWSSCQRQHIQHHHTRHHRRPQVKASQWKRKCGQTNNSQTEIFTSHHIPIAISASPALIPGTTRTTTTSRRLGHDGTQQWPAWWTCIIMSSPERCVLGAMCQITGSSDLCGLGTMMFQARSGGGR